MADGAKVIQWEIVFEPFEKGRVFCRVQPMQDRQPDTTASGSDAKSGGAGLAHPGTSDLDAILLLPEIPIDIHQYDVFLGVVNGNYTYRHNSINGLTQTLCSHLTSLTYAKNQKLISWFRDENFALQESPVWLDLSRVSEGYSGSSMQVEETQARFAISYVFWKGILEFLRSEENWRRLNARFMYLVAAWQWFYLARFLAGRHYRQLMESGGQQSYLTPSWANNELVQATRLLQTMLRDPEYANARRLLYYHLKLKLQDQQQDVNEKSLKIVWFGRKSSKLTRPRNPQTKDSVISDAQNIRVSVTPDEQLLLSMVIVQEPAAQIIVDQSVQTSDYLCGDREVYDPAIIGKTIPWETGSVIQNGWVGDGFRWKGLTVHPVFATDRGWQVKEFVRQLIANVMLPHYQLFDALRMSYLLRRAPEQVGRARDKMSFANLVTSLFAGLIFLLVGIPLISLIPGMPALEAWPANLPYIALSWTTLITTAVFLGMHLDGSVAHYLLLPRLLGGMMVGYLALALQGESFLLKNTVFSSSDPVLGWVLAAIILIGTLWIGFTYLKFECLSIIHDNRISTIRAAVLLFTSLIASALIGLFVVGLTTAMEKGDNREIHQLLWMIGPAGVIDLRQYLVFVPLAMLTGFVSQFIFEDKAITASIWEDK